MNSDSSESKKVLDVVWSVATGIGIAFLVVYILTVTSGRIHFIYEGF